MKYIPPALLALILVPHLVLADIVPIPDTPIQFEDAAKLTLSIDIDGESLPDQSASPFVYEQPFSFSYSIGYKDDWFFDPDGELTDEDRQQIFNEELARNASYLSLWFGKPFSPEGGLIELWDISGKPTGTLETTIPEGLGDEFFFLFDVPDYVLRDPEGACAEVGDPPELCEAETTLGGQSLDRALMYILSPTGMLDRGDDGVYTSRGFGGVRFTVASTTTGRASNVLFLPGIQGSRLYEKVAGIENRRWELTPLLSQRDARALYLNEDGTSAGDIYVKEGEIVAHAEVPFGGFDVYRTFIEQLTQLKNDGTIQDFLAFPYDWRMDPVALVEKGVPYAGELRFLVDEVVALAERSTTSKVTIVGHSNGGLVAKALVKKLEEDGLAHLVDTVMLVAVPQLGTPQAIVPMLHGDFGALTSFGGLYLDKVNARGLAEYMPDAYALLPSKEYLERVSDPIIDLTKAPVLTRMAGVTEHITTPAAFSQFLTARPHPQAADIETPHVLSSTLLATASATHDALDAWVAPDRVRTIEIAGWGLDTPKGVAYEEEEKRQCAFLGLGCRIETSLTHRALMTAEGDGTVIGESQLAAEGDRYVIDLNAMNRSEGRNWRHADITETSAFQGLFASLLRGDDTLPPHVSRTPPSVADHGRLRLRVLSPVSLDAYDSEGRHTGPVTLSGTDLLYKEEEIPNSYYVEFGEGKYLGLPGAEDLRVELRGLGTGTFTYEVESLEQDMSRVFTYPDLPVTTSTKAVMEIRDGDASTAVLEIDSDGDGDIDLRPLPEGTGETPLSYLEYVKSTLALMGLPKAAARQLLAKYTNVEHLLRKSGKWDTVDDDEDRPKVRPGDLVVRLALAKIDRIDLWIRLDQLRANLPTVLKKLVRLESMSKKDADTLLAMNAHLRMLID